MNPVKLKYIKIIIAYIEFIKKNMLPFRNSFKSAPLINTPLCVREVASTFGASYLLVGPARADVYTKSMFYLD